MQLSIDPKKVRYLSLESGSWNLIGYLYMSSASTPFWQVLLFLVVICPLLMSPGLSDMVVV